MKETFYHGSSALFKEFDLSHILEGDGKVKFGYGIYVTSQYRSAAHYAGVNPAAKKFYVYTVEIPIVKRDNGMLDYLLPADALAFTELITTCN